MIDLHYELHGRLGSFWTEKYQGEALLVAKALSQLSMRTSTIAKLAQAMDNLSGVSTALAGPLEVRFSPKSVVMYGPELQKRFYTQFSDGSTVGFYRKPTPQDYDFPATGHVPLREDNAAESDTILLISEENDYLLFPVENTAPVTPEQHEWFPFWIVGIPRGLYPLRLRVGTQDLLLGVDFTVGEGALILPQPPENLFRDQILHISSALIRSENLLNYSAAVEPVYGPMEPIIDYYRRRQSYPQLLRAAAAASNFLVMPQTAIVLGSYSDWTHTHYEFSFGTLSVDYPHQELAIGTEVRAGEIVGKPVEILCAKQAGDTDWWRAISWPAGLSLKDLCPFPSVVVPDRAVGVYAEESTNGKLHAILSLEGESSDLQKFWYAVKRSENITGKYLNDVLGLSSLEDFKSINPLDFYFQYLLADRAAVIIRRNYTQWGEDRRNRFSNFIAREKPFGSLIIYRDDA